MRASPNSGPKDKKLILKEQVSYRREGWVQWYGILELYEDGIILKASAPYARLVGAGIGPGEPIPFSHVIGLQGGAKGSIVPKSEFSIGTSMGLKWHVEGSPSLFSAVEHQYEKWKSNSPVKGESEKRS